MEGIRPGQSRGIDSCAQIGFGIGGPFGSIAVGDFALDNAGPQGALADIVGGIDFSGEVAESEQLVTRTPDLAEQFVRQFAVCGSGEDGVEVTYQRTPSAFHGGGGERGNVARQAKRTIKPELEAHTDKVGAVPLDEARLAIEMSKASLVVVPMALLARIAI